MNRVIIISPFSGETEMQIEANKLYAKLCLVDCLKRNESPMAFHLIYPQVLDDKNPEFRKRGIKTAHAWYDYCDYFVVYEDYGISKGMSKDIEKARQTGKKIIFRKLYG